MSESLFIGRERELARLAAFLECAISGKGQVAFVTGEAGSGKTVLVNVFAARVQDTYPNLVVATANCNAQGGISDPYLPFRELLGQLAGTTPARKAKDGERLQQVTARTVQLLLEVGPNLIDAFVPAAGLAMAVSKFVVEKAGWANDLEKIAKGRDSTSEHVIAQDRIFEQYANVLCRLSREHPLLLILDDLHWSDEASASLLFHLTRRIEGSRIFVLGTYRADEVPTQTEHSALGKALLEIKRYAGDVWVDVGAANEIDGRQFVDQLIDSERNNLTSEFRAALFLRTCGHPLFTIELLRMLQERGDLHQDIDGRWTVGTTLDWDTLPARVEGVIEERLGRLDANQRELLQVAAVQGVTFFAEVVAGLQGLGLRAALKQLSEHLGRRHQLVREMGDQKAGKQWLTAYQFAHALFQHYLYTNLGSGERRLLHAEIARGLEDLFSEDKEQVCAQLAWHYELAGQEDRAIDYLILAGERAKMQGATAEAKQFFTRALDLLTPTDLRRRQRALLGRIRVLRRRGERESLQADVQGLLKCASELADEGQRAHALLWRSMVELSAGEFPAAISAADEAAEAARKAGNSGFELWALASKTSALENLGNTEEANEIIDRVLPEAQALGEPKTLLSILYHAAMFYSRYGDYGRSIDLFPQAIALAHDLAFQDPTVSEGLLRCTFGDLLMKLGLLHEAREQFEQSITLCEATGERMPRAFALLNLGMVYCLIGDGPNARGKCEQALGEFVAIDDPYGQSCAFDCLGRIYERAKDWSAAREYFVRSRDGFERIGIRALAMESAASLASSLAALGEVEKAQSLATEVWKHVCEHGTAGMDFGIRVYRIVADILSTAGESDNSTASIKAGYNDLMTRAAKLSNSEWRRIFLERVADNRVLAEKWQNMHKMSEQL